MTEECVIARESANCRISSSSTHGKYNDSLRLHRKTEVISNARLASYYRDLSKSCGQKSVSVYVSDSCSVCAVCVIGFKCKGKDLIENSLALSLHPELDSTVSPHLLLVSGSLISSALDQDLVPSQPLSQLE